MLRAGLSGIDGVTLTEVSDDSHSTACTSAGVSPGRMRQFTSARAIAERIGACPPSSIVGTQVGGACVVERRNGKPSRRGRVALALCNGVHVCCCLSARQGGGAFEVARVVSLR